jgi:integrase
MREGTMRDRPRYVTEDVDRHGNVRLYFRRKGQPKLRLPPMDAPEFAATYRAALAGDLKPEPTKRAAVVSGSLRGLCAEYYKSALFTRLELNTRSVRRSILERFCQHKNSTGEPYGDLPYKLLEARHIRKVRDELAEKPEAANNLVKALRQLYGYATEYDLAERNPARDVSRIHTGSDGFHTWTPEEVREFEERHAVGTKARLALALMLYAGLRRSDAVLIGRQHVKNGHLVFTVTKNRNRKPVTLHLPILPELQAIMDATPSGNLTFLVTQFGKPFTAAGFGNWFRRRCDEAKLLHCSAHGLRKAGATIAAENGATEYQLMAIFGWASPKQAALYTKAARQKVLAGSAMPLLVGHSGNESVPLSDVVPDGGTLLASK